MKKQEIEANITYFMNIDYRTRELCIKHYPSLDEKYDSYEEYERSAHYKCNLALDALDYALMFLGMEQPPRWQKCQMRFSDIKRLIADRTRKGHDVKYAVREYAKLYELRGRPGPDALAIVDELGEQLSHDSHTYYSVRRKDPPRIPRAAIQIRPLAESLEEHKVDNGAENLAGASFNITIPNFNGPYERGSFINRQTAPHDGFTEQLTQGAYLLYDKGEVIYVGASTDLRKRIPQHSDKQYDAFAFIVTEEYPHMIEALLIAKYKPKYNTVGARPHKQRKTAAG